MGDGASDAGGDSSAAPSPATGGSMSGADGERAAGRITARVSGRAGCAFVRAGGWAFLNDAAGFTDAVVRTGCARATTTGTERRMLPRLTTAAFGGGVTPAGAEITGGGDAGTVAGTAADTVAEAADAAGTSVTGVSAVADDGRAACGAAVTVVSGAGGA